MKIVILVRIPWTVGVLKLSIKETESLQKLVHNVKFVFLRETENGKLLHDAQGNANWEIYLKSGKTNIIHPFVKAHFATDRKGEGTVDYDLITYFAENFTRIDADYLIGHDQFAGIVGYKIEKRLGIPYSVFMRERVYGYPVNPILGKLVKYFKKKILFNANAFFSVTVDVSESVGNLYSISFVPNIPEMELESKAPFEIRKYTLLSVSVWDRNRDPRTYPPMTFKFENFKLVVVGRRGEEELWKNFVEKLDELKIRNLLNLLEGFTEDDLISLFREAKLSISYGMDELGVGESNLKSLSQFNPVIVNLELGSADFVQSKNDGYVSKIWNSKDIYRFMIKHNDQFKYSELHSNIKRELIFHSWRSNAEILLEEVVEKNEHTYYHA